MKIKYSINTYYHVVITVLPIKFILKWFIYPFLAIRFYREYFSVICPNFFNTGELWLKKVYKYIKLKFGELNSHMFIQWIQEDVNGLIYIFFRKRLFLYTLLVLLHFQQRSSVPELFSNNHFANNTDEVTKLTIIWNTSLCPEKNTCFSSK